VSIYTFFKKKSSLPDTILWLLPISLFAAMAISLSYSTNISQGLKVLSSQFKFLAVPLIFLVHRHGIKGRILQYFQIFITATSFAAFVTFLFFLLPNDWVQKIAEAIPLLKDYVVHEKALAFGVYSPFTERLQFSYLIGVAIFCQLWVVFGLLKTDGVSSPYPPPEGENSSANRYHNAKKENNYFLPIFKLIILFLTLLILGARGAQISFLIASIIWLISGYLSFIHPSINRRFNALFSYSILGLSLVFFLGIAPFVAYKKIPAVKVRYDQLKWEIGVFQDGTYENYDYTHFTSIRRLLSWKNSWTIIKDQPILGVGIGDYKAEMEKEYARDKLGFPVNTQSQFLYFWTASGILGWLSLLFLLGYPMFRFFKEKRIPLKLFGLSFLIFYSLLFLFDAPLNFQVGNMTFLTFYGCLVVLIDEK